MNIVILILQVQPNGKGPTTCVRAKRSQYCDDEERWHSNNYKCQETLTFVLHSPTLDCLHKEPVTFTGSAHYADKF